LDLGFLWVLGDFVIRHSMARKVGFDVPIGALVVLLHHTVMPYTQTLRFISLV
jgi:hypothetical protein